MSTSLEEWAELQVELAGLDCADSETREVALGFARHGRDSIALKRLFATTLGEDFPTFYRRGLNYERPPGAASSGD